MSVGVLGVSVGVLGESVSRRSQSQSLLTRHRMSPGGLPRATEPTDAKAYGCRPPCMPRTVRADAHVCRCHIEREKAPSLQRTLRWYVVVRKTIVGGNPHAMAIELQVIRLSIDLTGSPDDCANHSPRWRFSHRSSIRFMKPDGPFASG